MHTVRRRTSHSPMRGTYELLRAFHMMRVTCTSTCCVIAAHSCALHPLGIVLRLCEPHMGSRRRAMRVASTLRGARLQHALKLNEKLAAAQQRAPSCDGDQTSSKWIARRCSTA